MKISEAVALGYTFFVVAFLGIVAGGVVGEIFSEGPWLFKLDEQQLVAIGVVAIVWCLLGNNRYQRSLVPLVLAVVSFAAKVLGLILEFYDTVEAGDDYGIVQTLLLLVIVAVVVYVRWRVPAE